MTKRIIKDDRTPEQKETHCFIIVARDTFMSGWGECEGGLSRCAWATDSKEKADKVFAWVKSRSEMKSVRIKDARTFKVPSKTKHFHYYVVDHGHPSLLENK